MNDKYDYIPDQETLINLYKKEYNEIIKHNEQNDITMCFDEIVKESLFSIYTELFLDNHYCECEEICSSAGSKEYDEVKKIVCERLNINTEFVSSPDISYSIIFKKEFKKILKVINTLVIPRKYIDTFKLLSKEAVSIKLEYIADEEYSNLHFLGDEFEIISTSSMPTSYVEHLTNIYNKKDYWDKNGIIKYNVPNIFDLIEYIEYLIDDEAKDKTEGTMQETLNNVQN